MRHVHLLQCLILDCGLLSEREQAEVLFLFLLLALLSLWLRLLWLVTRYNVIKWLKQDLSTLDPEEAYTYSRRSAQAHGTRHAPRRVKRAVLRVGLELIKAGKVVERVARHLSKDGVLVV